MENTPKQGLEVEWPLAKSSLSESWTDRFCHSDFKSVGRRQPNTNMASEKDVWNKLRLYFSREI